MNITTCLFGLLLLPTVTNVKEIHVSPQGDDTRAGTVQEPIQTLERAQERFRELNTDARDYAIKIVLHEGLYQLKQPLLFDRDDSSPSEYPTVIESMPSERVTISGAEFLDDLGLITSGADLERLPLESRTHVHLYRISDPDLKSKLEHYLRSDESEMLPSPIDVFKNGDLMPIACYPGKGSWAIAGQSRLENLDVSLNKTSLWRHSLSSFNDQDRYDRLTRENLESLPSGTRYRVENSIDHLDEPGEWCFDETSSVVYWWPKSDDSSLNAVSVETLISMYEVENMIVRGICFEGARVQGVEIAGGSNCRIENCEFRCIGNVGVHIFHGEHHTIKDCAIHATGSSGIQIEGGDAALDIKADHQCINNTVYECCQKNMCRHAGIAVFGCGITLVKNSVSDLPDWGISLQGSHHEAVENDIRNVCFETSDTGAIYLAGSAYTRGNLIHGNHIHDVGAFDRQNAFAVYLDGMTQNNHVSENIIHDVIRAVVVRDGQENVIDHNAVYDCLIGIQIEQNQEVAQNEIESNALACQHPIVCNHDRSVLTAANNTKNIERIFANYRSGDFEISSTQSPATDGFKSLHLPQIEERKSYPVSTTPLTEGTTKTRRAALATK